jgi:hypothetical protein
MANPVNELREISDKLGSETAFNELKVAQTVPLCGWTFAHNVNPAIVRQESNGSGSVTHVDNKAHLSTGTDSDGQARIETIKTSRYVPGLGGLVRFTAVFSEPAENSQQLVGLFDALDGWGFGYNGLQFGIFRRSDGVTTWYYQEDWNKHTMPNLDQTKGNIYQIEYQWLGYGAQYFGMESEDGELIDVHTIYYANTSATTSIDNPNLPMAAEVINDGNTTDITLESPSAMAGLDGEALSAANSVVLADDVSNKSVASGTNVPVISFYNPETWLSKNNRLFVKALRLVLASDGTKSVTISVYANGTVNGGSFAEIVPNVSPIQVNKTFTSLTTTGAVKIGSFPLAKVDSTNIDLNASEFFGYPGQYITIVATGTGSTEISAGISYRQYL